VKTLKKTPLTVRRCPTAVHEALKQSAAANHRSLNGEALTWLERQAVQKPVTARELAAALRKWHRQFSRKEHLEIAARIEEGRRLMNREHLH
jgi:plasmid stability protein